MWNGRKEWKKALRVPYDALISGIIRSIPSSSVIIKSRGCGFFGDVFMTLNGIRFAQMNNSACRVEWGKESLYYDPQYGKNVWNYYFKCDTFNFLEKVSGAARGVALPYLPDAETFVPYNGATIRQSCFTAVNKWCELNDRVKGIVAKKKNIHISDTNTLGVHIRLTDAAVGAEGRSPIDLNYYILRVSEWLKFNPDGNIYLATDDVRVIDLMVKKFPRRIGFQDCIRSDDGKSIHGHYDIGASGSPFKKGLEVIIDAYLLSYCSHLIRSHSRVTAFSICANDEITFECLDDITSGSRPLGWLWN